MIVWDWSVPSEILRDVWQIVEAHWGLVVLALAAIGTIANVDGFLSFVERFTKRGKLMPRVELRLVDIFARGGPVFDEELQRMVFLFFIDADFKNTGNSTLLALRDGGQVHVTGVGSSPPNSEAGNVMHLSPGGVATTYAGIVALEASPMGDLQGTFDLKIRYGLERENLRETLRVSGTYLYECSRKRLTWQPTGDSAEPIGPFKQTGTSN